MILAMIFLNEEITILKIISIILIGTIVNCSVDEEYLDKKGNIDVNKMEIITFHMVSNTYRVLGEVVGNAFKDGLKLKYKLNIFIFSFLLYHNRF